MRDTEKRGMGDKNVVFFLSLSLSASKFLNGSQTLIIFHSVTAITCGGDRSNEEYLALSCIVGLAAVVLADVFA